MKRHILTAAAAAVLMAGIPAAAHAQNAVATATVNMRTGPSTGYPVITAVPAGAPVQVRGCTSGYSWCDTTYGNARGWVSGSYLAGSSPQYRSRRIPEIGAALGIGIIAGTIFNELRDDDRGRPGRPGHGVRDSRHHNDRESRFDRHSPRDSRSHNQRESRFDRHGNRESRFDRHSDRESRANWHSNRESRFDSHDRARSRMWRWDHQRATSRWSR